MNTNAVLALLSALTSSGLAVWVISTPHRTWSHWLFVLGMMLGAGEAICAALAVEAILPLEMAYWHNLRIFLFAHIPAVWLAFSLSYARGNFRESWRQAKYQLVTTCLLPSLIVAVLNFPVIAAATPAGANQQWVFTLSVSGLALHLCFLLGAVLVILNLERTYRAAVGTARWRIKFMLLGLGFWFLVRAYTCMQNLLFHTVTAPLLTWNAAALLIANFMMLRSLLRTGHFEVSVYPSQAIQRNSATLLLAGVYLVGAGLLAKLASHFGGESAVTFSQRTIFFLLGLALVCITLMSDHVRLQIKRFMSRHFQRSLHDYRAVWRNFTETTAARLDQTDLCRAVVKLVASHFQALAVTLWVLDDKKENLAFAASSFLTDAQGQTLAPQGQEAAAIREAMLATPEPVDIEDPNGLWASALKKCHPSEFPNGGSRMAVPLITGGELIGLMTLGDRVGGAPFLQPDIDLLKCIGDQIGANLRNLQLSNKLLQVKELEAFQAMSTFFVHDLKNTASTLGLMLQNLPIHFNDPAFREDALRGIAKTVEHINQLITRLSTLRQGLKITPRETDLNDTVAQALAGHPMPAEIECVRTLEAIPLVAIDPEQIGKVITNLFLNALEAVGKRGKIEIRTTRQNAWAVLAVSDTGCGMRPEFLSQSLFRPFQTTKKNGLGIGMFQSKMIVEAHGGRIEVESEPGKGSTFRVFLPIYRGIP